jgi:imidazolonepropionase-like amidohydrolase
MKHDPGLSVLAVLIFQLVAEATLEAEPHILVSAHATVIDATGTPPQPDVTVVITDDRITAMGNGADIRPPTNAVVVNATGKFLIPGLWDMHVHWYEKDYLPLFIANGVTGVRMMWGMSLHHEWRKEIGQGSLVGPHLLLASTIVDGPKPTWPGSITAGTAAEGRQAVTRARQEGADFVKVYSVLPREAYFAIAEESKRQGLPFAGHVPIAVPAQEASAAGQKTIEHLTGILAACSSREADLLKSAQEELSADPATTNEPTRLIAHLRHESELALDTYRPAKAEALFAEFKRNQTWQCPTLTVLRLFPFAADPSVTNDVRLKYMPPWTRFEWNAANSNHFANRSPEIAALGKRYFQKHLEIVGAMQQAGVGILAGTDTGNPYCLPGFSLHDELSLLVRAGLTPMEALQAATLNPARAMGRESDLGTAEKGKLADLVLLEANPLDDIANTRKIAAVAFGGRLFSQASLNEMLGRVEAIAGKVPIAEILLKTVKEKDVEAAVEQYHQLKSTQPAAYDFREEQLNYLGYQLLRMKRNKEAITILKLNAEVYPQSSNVYDSLGEAYLADDDKALAIVNYEKSLQLDPGNHGAIEKLNRLKAP